MSQTSDIEVYRQRADDTVLEWLGTIPWFSVVSKDVASALNEGHLQPHKVLDGDELFLRCRKHGGGKVAYRLKIRAVKQPSFTAEMVGEL